MAKGRNRFFLTSSCQVEFKHCMLVTRHDHEHHAISNCSAYFREVSDTFSDLVKNTMLAMYRMLCKRYLCKLVTLHEDNHYQVYTFMQVSLTSACIKCLIRGNK